MTVSQEIFFRECASHSRVLSVSRSVEFLRGMLETCPVNEITDELRGAFNLLMESDHQLKLIQSGQLTLPFPPAKPKSKIKHRKSNDGDGNGHDGHHDGHGAH